MKVLFATSELTPIVKVGGLGDVSGALPPALKRLGVDIRVIIPRYDTIDKKAYPLKSFKKNIEVTWGGKKEFVNIFTGQIPKSEVLIYFLENETYLSRGGVYFEKSAFVGSFKEIERFLFFSLAAVQSIPYLDFAPDIIHCQDWHTAVLPLLLQIQSGEVRHPVGRSNLQKLRTLFTIHNLANQGRWGAKEILDFLGLKGEEHPNLARRHQGPYGEELVLMEQGILGADYINAVSETYAQEILTKQYGEGLEGTLKSREGNLFGILNGIDVERFNPETDPNLKATYTLDSLEKRRENKEELQRLTGLPQDPGAPLLGFVGRLTDQKGSELLNPTIDELLREKVQIVLLGSGAEKYEREAQELREKYPRNIFVQIGFDASLAQKIYGGCDVFLMPSRFEPCGLGQMIAMRYGAVPVVRATGGLKDTVQDGKTGFVFEKYEPGALREALRRALELFQDKKQWQQLQKNGMKKDFSWEKSAKDYLKLYEKLVKL